MSGVHLDRLLASTAMVLLLTGSLAAQPVSTEMTDEQISAAVPMPDTSMVPPPTAQDVDTTTPVPAETTGAAPDPASAETQIINPDPAVPESATTQTATPAPAAVPEAAPAPEAASAPEAAPAAAAVADGNTPIAEKLRDLAAGKFDRIVGGKKERTLIDAFYSGRDYAPLWLTDGKASDRAKAAISYLGHVDTEGLDPADYPVPDFRALSDPAALAEAELKLTAAVLTFAHHAQMGRVHWSRISADIFYNQTAPEPADVLADMAGATDVGAALAAYNPQHPGYKALKAKLAEIRANKGDTGQERIPGGPVLKVGMHDARVPQLRERLGMSGDGETYDKALAAAVKTFQQQHKIAANGTLTTATLDALNGRTPDRAADIIIANMERWRWLPHQLGKTYVMVNIPDFSLRVMRNGHQEWMTRIVTGKPGMPTPIMSAEMKFITVNPTWNVPPSIVANEYLPALKQDPTVLTRMGLRVTHNGDGTVHIYQPPGDGNALGRLRFNFPNKFLVYQHDTPDKYLFAHDKRAYSHGCMRVQDPVRYAEVLLNIVRPGDGYTQERIRKMFGPNEVDIQFPSFIPVHLTYQTAFVDDAGKLQLRDDVYGRDSRILAALRGEERKVADVPIERKDNPVRRAVLALPDQGWGGGRGWGGPMFGGGGGGVDGQNFFARLFSPFAAAPQPPAPVQRRPVAQQRRPTAAQQRTVAR